MQIAYLLYDRFTALDAVGPYEVLRLLPGARVQFVAKTAGIQRSDARTLGIIGCGWQAESQVACIRAAAPSIARVVESWRRDGGDVVAASYAGRRGHPLVVARSVWDAVPDEGLRAGEKPRLVPCDDLGAPGDVDTPDDL